jgi:predicted small metal-binding protein
MDRIATRVANRYKMALGIGETVELGSVRIHRYAEHIVVTDLTNAGKRGKKCKELTVSGGWKASKDEMDVVAKMVGHMRDYGKVKETIEKHMKETGVELTLRETDLRGVDVLPYGFRPLDFHGQHVDVTVSLKDFAVRNIDDQANLPTCIPAVKGSPGDIPAFFRWVKDNPDKVQKATYADMLDVLKQLGVHTHQYCAVD